MPEFHTCTGIVQTSDFSGSQTTLIFTGSASFYLFIYLCIYLWLCWFFVAARGLSLVVVSGGLLFVAVRGLLLLRSTGSRHVGFSSCGAWALERRLSSCGARV